MLHAPCPAQHNTLVLLLVALLLLLAPTHSVPQNMLTSFAKWRSPPSPRSSLSRHLNPTMCLLPGHVPAAVSGSRDHPHEVTWSDKP
jgi:hypothetical protein